MGNFDTRFFDAMLAVIYFYLLLRRSSVSILLDNAYSWAEDELSAAAVPVLDLLAALAAALPEGMCARGTPSAPGGGGARTGRRTRYH